MKAFLAKKPVLYEQQSTGVLKIVKRTTNVPVGGQEFLPVE
jgi:hypothetical protein